MSGGPGAYSICEEEKKELLDVINAGYLYRYGKSDNPNFKHKVATFEEEFAHYTKANYALATSSGTGALMCCLVALGIGPGDEVIVPGYTFIATMAACIQCRAIPVLAEIDESLTIDVQDVRKKITSRTKAIIAVHMLGNPCKMNNIMNIAQEHNLYVVEDCCQAAGAKYKGQSVGTFGNIGAFSLNFYKPISSGDGGVVTTNHKLFYERSFAFHDQGHNPLRLGVEIGKRNMFGINLRMNEITGAVALAQLRKLDDIMYQLKQKKARLKDMLKDLPGVTFRQINDPDECCTLLTLLFDEKEKAEAFCAAVGTKTIAESGWHVYNNMEQLMEKKTGNDIGCPYSCPYYGGEISYSKHMLPQTDDLLERAVNISVGVVDEGLGSAFGININSTDDEIIAVGEKINQVVRSIN